MNSDSSKTSDDKNGCADGSELKDPTKENSDEGWEEFQFGEDKSVATDSVKASTKVEDNVANNYVDGLLDNMLSTTTSSHHTQNDKAYKPS